MRSIEARYAGDPVLLDFYKKMLLVRGWAGKLDDIEREYVKRMAPDWLAKSMDAGRKSAERGQLRPFPKKPSNPTYHRPLVRREGAGAGTLRLQPRMF